MDHQSIPIGSGAAELGLPAAGCPTGLSPAASSRAKHTIRNEFQSRRYLRFSSASSAYFLVGSLRFDRWERWQRQFTQSLTTAPPFITHFTFRKD